MQLGDLLKQLGDNPIKAHTWSNAVIGDLNAILPATVLTQDSTGTETLRAIDTLGVSDKDQILHSEVDLIKGTMVLTGSTASGPTTLKEEKAASSLHRELLKEFLSHPRQALATTIVIAISIALLIAVIVTTIDYVWHGKAFNIELLKDIAKFLSELLRDFPDR